MDWLNELPPGRIPKAIENESSFCLIDQFVIVVERIAGMSKNISL